MLRTLTTLVAAASLVVATGCSDDDDRDAAPDASETSNGASDDADDRQADVNQDAYDTTARVAFLETCAGQGGTDDYCQCTFDRIAATLPLEELVAFEAELLDHPDATPPQELVAAMEHCN